MLKTKELIQGTVYRCVLSERFVLITRDENQEGQYSAVGIVYNAMTGNYDEIIPKDFQLAEILD